MRFADRKCFIKLQVFLVLCHDDIKKWTSYLKKSENHNACIQNKKKLKVDLLQQNYTILSFVSTDTESTLRF